MTVSPHKLQETKERNIGQHGQAISGTGKLRKQKFQKKIYLFLACNNFMYKNLENCIGKDQNHSKESEHTQQEHYTNGNYEPSKTLGKFSTHLHSYFDCQTISTIYTFREPSSSKQRKKTSLLKYSPKAYNFWNGIIAT